MDDKVIEKIFDISERFFGTAADPTQIPSTMEAHRKFRRLYPKTIAYWLEDGEPVSWAMVLPTQRALMDRFLAGEITEYQMLELTVPQEKYEALYLFLTFTVEEHRRKGYAESLFKEAIAAIPLVAKAPLFGWAFSEAGGKLLEKLQKTLGRDILVKHGHD